MQSLSMALAPAPRFLVFDKNVIHHSRELALEYQCSQLEPLSWFKKDKGIFGKSALYRV